MCDGALPFHGSNLTMEMNSWQSTSATSGRSSPLSWVPPDGVEKCKDVWIGLCKGEEVKLEEETGIFTHGVIVVQAR